MPIINIENVTNQEESGIFDKLMQSISSNIEKQYLNNRITGSDYATVYLGSIQAALSQSIQFSLQEDMVAAQVDEVIDSTSRANIQLNDTLVTTAKQRILMDEEVETAGLQQIILQTEEELKTAQVIELVDSTTRSNTELTDKLATTLIQRTLLTEEVETAGLQQEILGTEEELKTAQKDEVLAATNRSDLELTDKLSTTLIQRTLLTEEIETVGLQQIILATEEELKTAQTAEVSAATVRNDSDIADRHLGTVKERVLLDEQIETAGLQQVILQTEELLKEAQKDEVLAATIRSDSDIADRHLGTVKERVLLDEQVETVGLQQVILGIEEDLKIAQKNEVLAATVRNDSDLGDKHLGTVKERVLLDEQAETAGLQQVILGIEEDLKIAQKNEVLAATIRSDSDIADRHLGTVKERVLLDEQVETVGLQQELVNAQIKTAYTERVVKDKQAAKLGMDNVMKLSEANRLSTPSFVYTPTYEGV